MPHYTDFNGFFAEIPANSNEFWGSFESPPDLLAGSDDVAWSQFAASPPPLLVVENPNAAFWQASGLPEPQIFAVMIDAQYANPADTDFRVWDVAWSGSTGAVTVRPGDYSLQSLIDEAGSAPTLAMENIYFEVTSLPALAVPSLDAMGALVLVASLLGSVFFARRRRPSRGQ